MIKNFREQLLFEPVIEYAEHLRSAESFILCGMGGSHLSAGLAKLYDPTLPLLAHYDYDLPIVSEDVLERSLLIASSFSGDTAETLSFVKEAVRKNLNLVIISSGGKIIEFAREHTVPYVLIPVNEFIQPRHALGFSVRALAKVLSRKDLFSALGEIANAVDPSFLMEEGKELAKRLEQKVPIIYSSNRNHMLAYMWKIEMNESPKIPAFFNMFPELNHNEIAGFDFTDATKNLSEIFSFIFLKDLSDSVEVQKRMDITAEIYKEKGLSVEIIELKGSSILEKAFYSYFLSLWTVTRLAAFYGTTPKENGLIEKFKQQL